MYSFRTNKRLFSSSERLFTALGMLFCVLTDDKSTADIFNTYIKEVKQPSHSVAYGVFCASAGLDKAKTLEKIGRASCRERV